MIISNLNLHFSILIQIFIDNGIDWKNSTCPFLQQLLTMIEDYVFQVQKKMTKKH